MGATVACTHPTIILLSVHKGASTFLTVDFAPAVAAAISGMRHVAVGQEIVSGREVEDLPIPSTGVIASRVYPFLYDTLVEDPEPEDGRFADKKLLMLRRDPRDVAVSLYYSIRFSHTSKTRNPEGFKRKKAALKSLDVRDGIAEETARTAIRQFKATFKFLDRYPQTCLTTYEQLILDFGGWYRTVCDHLELSGDEAARIRKRIEPSLAAPKKVNPSKHKRRVIPGNWREVFDDRLRTMFEEQVGRELEKAGYTWS